ncbi:MAG: hypothetical protein AAGA56_12270 [Myxococcota bacterium]
MKTKSYIYPDERLLWLYHYADPDLGVSAMPWEPAGGSACRATDPMAAALVPGWVSAPAPDERRIIAASRSTRYRSALRALSRLDRGCLAHCYGHRFAYLVGADGATQRALTARSHGEQARRWAEYQAAASRFGIAAAAVLTVVHALGLDIGKHTPKVEATIERVRSTVIGSHVAWSCVAKGLPPPPEVMQEAEDKPPPPTKAELHRKEVVALLGRVKGQLGGR